MSDDTGENSEIARTREITNKKKADRDLLLKKYRQNEDKLRTDQPSGQMDAISTEGPEKILKSKAENPNTTGELGDLLKRLNEKKEADKQMSTSPQETIEKADNEQVSSGRSIEETKVEEINIYKPKKAEEKATKNREIAIEGEEQETSKIGGSDKKTEIIGPSGELGSLLKRLNEKKEADKQMSTSPQEKIEKADNEQMSGGISVKETKVEKIAISKPEKAEEKLTGEEKGSTTEDEKELPLEESVETEGTANDLVKNILEEASTTDISQYIEQDDEEEEIEIEKKDLTEQNKEDIGFIDKVKNLFKQEEVEIEPYNLELHGPLCIFRGLEGYEELERRWVNEPYAFVVVLFNEEKNHTIYYVVEPELSEFEETFLTEIKDKLRDVLLVEELGEEEDKDAVLEENIRMIIKNYAIEITPPMLAKISYYIKRDFIRFGKIDPLMFDDTIEDVSGNGHDTPIFLYHKKHTNIETNIIYKEDELNSFIIRLAQRSGKHISVAEPMVDATMGDGSRIQMTLGTTITAHGSTFTIRKFSDVPITPIDLIKWNTFSAESMAYLWLCIENNKSLIYAGGTASGKTSSLNAVSLFIPEKAKVISLEDTRELQLPHINWIPALTRDSFTADDRGAIDMYDLLKGALRQRPEFLLVGEVRGKEALTLFQAMSTGHTTFSTMHADSISSAIHRLENPPISVPRTMIQALDIMSIQSQTYSNGKRVRRNLNLVEIVDIDPNTRNIRTNDIFVWDSTSDTFHRTGESKALADIQMRRGWTTLQVRQELIYRQKVLEYMVNNDVNNFQEISGIINAYQATPEKVLKKLKLIE